MTLVRFTGTADRVGLLRVRRAGAPLAGRATSADVDQQEEVVAAWSNPQGALAKQTDDVRIIELTLKVSTRGPVNRDGIPYNQPSKTEAEIVEAVARWLHVHGDRWPKWLRTVEIDAVYLEGDDE